MGVDVKNLMRNGYYKEEILKIFAKRNIPTMSVEELDKHDKILFSTFGFHDTEPPHSIISRKLDELKKNKNQFALWGVNAGKERVKQIENFCKEIAKSSQKDVLLLLKFTGSLIELKKKCLSYSVCTILDETKDCTKCTDLWSNEQLDDGKLFNSCTINGKPFDLKSHNIFVKGSKNQNKAFVIERFYLFEGLSFKEIKTTYYKKWKDIGFINQGTNMLERNRSEDLKKMNGEDWGIVVKLKAPDYIVECF